MSIKELAKKLEIITKTIELGGDVNNPETIKILEDITSFLKSQAIIEESLKV